MMATDLEDDGRALQPEERAKLRRAVEELGGERAAALVLQVSRQTIARALAVLPLTRGTVLLLRQQLSGVELENKGGHDGETK